MSALPARCPRFELLQSLQENSINYQGETNMAKRTASAVWEGTLREGKGTVKLGSGAFEGQYSFASRFESGTGTNPEELIGAAHAGCFFDGPGGGFDEGRFQSHANQHDCECQSREGFGRFQDHYD